MLSLHAGRMLPACPPGNLVDEHVLTCGFKQEGPASGVMLLGLAGAEVLNHIGV